MAFSGLWAPAPRGLVCLQPYSVRIRRSRSVRHIGRGSVVTTTVLLLLQVRDHALQRRAAPFLPGGRKGLVSQRRPYGRDVSIIVGGVIRRDRCMSTLAQCRSRPI